MHFKVYGVDRSPWVQAVLLGLYDRKIEYSLTTVPPLSVFVSSGIVMPAASIDDGEWQLESVDILGHAGYDAVSPQDTRALYTAWRGVVHRPDSAFEFFNAFSKITDPHPNLLIRLLHHFLRSFATVYFFLLIRTAGRRRLLPDPPNFGDQFLYWQDRLAESDGPFIGGDHPDTRDLLLFGIVQCHCSIPVPPAEALRRDPRLDAMRSWIAEMNRRFADYPRLYSGTFFEPDIDGPRDATMLERAAFWTGSATMFLLFPITFPLIAFLAMRVRR